MEYVISTENLTKKFGDFTAVDRISLKVRQGEIFGVLGPNGAGKSTAVRMLCGILQPTSGSASVLGYDLIRETEKIKPRIGYMSQKYSLYDDLTVLENLKFYAGLYSIPRKELTDRLDEMLVMADLLGRENELAANLSSGWKQRLALGCAIISNPTLIFLDEPTSGVSPTSRRMFFQLIRRMVNEGRTVIVTTHFMDEAERCHRVAFIAAGRLIAVDEPDNLKKKVIRGCMVEAEYPFALQRTGEIEQLPFVRDCTIHGSLLHILLEKEEDIPKLVAFLKSPVRIITPSLEDVFVTLSRQQRSENKAAKAGINIGKD